MKTRLNLATALLLSLACAGPVLAQSPTAITYQGRLLDGGQPANGYYDLRFSLHADAALGAPVANVIAKPPLAVSNGVFTTTLDFGAAGFSGGNRWLEIAVRPTGSREDHVTLAPRQRITAAPYALQAASVADGAVTAQKLSADGGQDGQVLTLSNGELTWGSEYSGSGIAAVNSGLGLAGGPITNVGTLAIDTNIVPLLNAANAFGIGPQSIASGGAANPALIVRGAPGQAANLQEWQDAAGAVTAAVRPDGGFIGNGVGLTNLGLTQAGYTNLAGSYASFTNQALVINVLDYMGARNSGNINADTANFQRALDQVTNAPPVGFTAAQDAALSTVYVPEGTYYLNDTIWFRRWGTKLKGAGRERTRIYFVNSTANLFGFQPTAGSGSPVESYLFGIHIEDLEAVSLAPINDNRSTFLKFASPPDGFIGGTWHFARLRLESFYRGFDLRFFNMATFSELKFYCVNTAYYFDTPQNASISMGQVFGGRILNNGANPSGTNLFGAGAEPSRGIFITNSYPGASMGVTAFAWELGDVDKAVEANSGQVTVIGGNFERVHASVFHLREAAAGNFLNNRVGHMVAGVDRPYYEFEHGAGGRSTIIGGTYYTDESLHAIRLNAPGDYVNYSGQRVVVTNAALGIEYVVPQTLDTVAVQTNLTVAYGRVYPTNGVYAGAGGVGPTDAGSLLWATRDASVSAGLESDGVESLWWVGGLGANFARFGTRSSHELRFTTGDTDRLIVNPSGSVFLTTPGAAWNGNGSGLTNLQESALNYWGTNPPAGRILASTASNTPAWFTAAQLGLSGGGGTLALTNGGTGSSTAAGARANLGAAASGANTDITALSGLITPLSAAQGGSGNATYAVGDLLYASAANVLTKRAIGAAGQVLATRNGIPVWTNANDHDHFGRIWSGTSGDGLFVENFSALEGASGLTGVVRDTNAANYGVFGQSPSVQGVGVQGLATAATGATIGVGGETASPAGIGVYGLATATSGTNTGVYGDCSGPFGSGVYGLARATNGTPVGVFGYCVGTNGYGLYTPNRLYVGNNAYVGGHLTLGTNSRIQAHTGSSNAPAITFFGNPTVGIFSPATNQLGLVTSGNQRLHIASDGKVGIGRVAAANRLEVQGEASKLTAGNWLANSDAAIKTDVKTVTGALAKLERVRPVTFRYTDEYRRQHPGIEDKTYYNVIAQEFAEVFPEAVKSSGETIGDREVLQVDTYPATITAMAAVRELHQLVTELRSQNEQLAARLTALEKRIGTGAK